MSKDNRIIYLDIFRFLMVSAALLSHVLGNLDIWGNVSPMANISLRLLTRGATPGLLILFGFMLEFVYVRYAQRYGYAHSLQRILYRAALCYVAFVLVALAGLLGGRLELDQFFAALVLLRPSPNANIFTIYFFILLISTPIILLRLKAGIASLLWVIAGIWLLDALIVEPLSNPFILAPSPLLYLTYPLDLFVGLGDTWGPSIFHGLTAVLFGMVMANAFVTRTRQALATFASLVGLSAAIILFEGVTSGYTYLLVNIADYSGYRAHNSEVYFAYGILHAVTLISVAWALNRVIVQRIRAPMTYLGSRTFIYFLISNVFLTALSRVVDVSSLSAGLAFFVLLVTMTYGSIWLWENQLSKLPMSVQTRQALEGASHTLTDQVVLGKVTLDRLRARRTRQL